MGSKLIVRVHLDKRKLCCKSKGMKEKNCKISYNNKENRKNRNQTTQ